MGRFTLPRDLYHGAGSLETLKTLTGKKAIVVVGGGSMKRFGFLDKAVAYLKEAGMEVQLFEGVEPDPSVETVMKGAEAMRSLPWAAVLRLMLRKQCGYSMSIRTRLSKRSLRRLVSPRCGQRQSSVRFRLPLVLQQKLPLSL